jgi:hypothetical protein
VTVISSARHEARKARREAKREARKVARSRILEVATRTGFAGYGLLHLLVGWLAWQIALGHRTAEGDQSGAFHTVASKPGGHVLLILIAVGLGAMAVWQLLLAAIGHQREEHRTAERLLSLGRVIVYTTLAWTAAEVVAGAPVSNAAQQQRATAGLLGTPGGHWLVGIAGVLVIALGLGQMVYGARTTFERRLRVGQMSPRIRSLAMWLGRAGYVARGAAVGVVGILLISAASQHKPEKSRGLDAALRSVAAQSYGEFLLGVIAFGFAAFGLYCFLQVKWRKV